MYRTVSDSATVDICMATETQIVGRTLFTLLDSRRWRDPLGGAVCRCTAESVRWPTTNTIAVFVVDMRLNALRQSQCSKVGLLVVYCVSPNALRWASGSVRCVTCLLCHNTDMHHGVYVTKGSRCNPHPKPLHQELRNVTYRHCDTKGIAHNGLVL